MGSKFTNGIMELANKLNTGEISENDPLIKKAEKALSNMYRTSDGQIDISEIITQYLEDNFNKNDITQLVFDMKHFKLGQRPLFKTHKKGIVAYKTAPDSLVPMSQNYETEVEMSFYNLGVHPTCLKRDLKTGRVDSFATLIKDAMEAVDIKRIEMVWELLAQVYNATSNKENYFKTNTVNKTSLDGAINRVRKKVGGRPTIMGDYDLMTEIEKFEEFKGLEEVYKEIKNYGLLGTYRACKMVYMPEILNPVTQESIVPTDKIMVVGQKIGYAATLGDAETDHRNNFDDKSWEYRYDKQIGHVVTKPEGLAVVHVIGEGA